MWGLKAILTMNLVSNRTAYDNSVVFGAALATALALLSLALTWSSGETNPLPLMLGAWCFILLLWSPDSFRSLLAAWKWFWLGIAQLVIMMIWFLYILPAGLIMQMRGKDPLHLRFQPAAQTYWKKPHPTGNMTKSA